MPVPSPFAFVSGTAPDLIAVLDLFPKCAGCGCELHASASASVTLAPNQRRALCASCSGAAS